MSFLRPVFELLGQKLGALLETITPGGKARIVVVLLLVLILGWGGAMWLTHKIDDNPNYAVAPVNKGESAAVAIAAALIDREVNQHPWVANDPFFLPGYYLDNMPNFQQGVIYALGRFTVLLGDQLGRSRGSSQIDPDLDQAAGLLKYPGNVWIFNTQTSLLPTASSQAQYRGARKALLSYNERLAQGKAVFDPRADNLVAALDSIAGDLGSQSATIEEYLSQKHFWFAAWYADDIFYATKGRVYTYYLLLRELEKDYAQVIRERDLTNVWNNMLRSLREAATLQPVVIICAAPDSQFLPSHLASQGFYLLRARTNLREITGILSK